MGLLPNTQTCRLRMRCDCRERFPPPPTSKETTSWRYRHASLHVRDVRDVRHVSWWMSGSFTRGGGENVPGIPGACTPAILRIWQEAHFNCMDIVSVFVINPSNLGPFCNQFRALSISHDPESYFIAVIWAHDWNIDVIITLSTTKTWWSSRSLGVDLPCLRKKICHQNTMWMRWKVCKFKDEDLTILRQVRYFLK